jgi:uncharacterized protein YndB with AHSA1/START domain
VNPLTVSIIVARPREDVFEYLVDIANHPEFTDHFLVDWHLTRLESRGTGAGARFRFKTRRNRFGWGDVTLVRADPPWRLVAAGRGGKFNRVRSLITYELSQAPGTMTRVEMTMETEPALASDRIAEVGQRRWLRRANTKALKRLRAVLEDGERRGRRATVAGR